MSGLGARFSKRSGEAKGSGGVKIPASGVYAELGLRSCARDCNNRFSCSTIWPPSPKP